MIRSSDIAPPIAIAVAMALVCVADQAYQSMRTDMGIYLYAGWVLAEGGTVYLDFWEHKGPLFFLLNAVGAWLTPGKGLGLVLFEGAMVAGAFIVLERLLRRRLGLEWSFLAVLFALAAYLHFYHYGGFVQTLAVPAQVAAMAGFLGALDRGGRGWFLLVGFAFAWGALLLPTSGASASVFAVVLFVHGWRSRGFGEAAVRGLWMSAGALSLIVPMVAWVWAEGAVAAGLEQYLIYNFLYVDNAGGGHRLESAMFFLFHLVGVGLFALLPSGLVGIGALGRWVGAGLAAAVALEFAMVILSGRTYTHYAANMAVATAPFVALALARLMPDRIRALGLLVALVPSGVLGYHAWEAVKGTTDRDRQRAVVEYVREATSPDETVLVLGVDPSLNFMAERRSPTRYMHQLPLAFPGFGTPERVGAFLDGLKAAPPALVVDTHDGNFTPMDAETLADGRMDAGLDVVRDWILANYAKETAMTWVKNRPAVIYRRRGP